MPLVKNSSAYLPSYTCTEKAGIEAMLLIYIKYRTHFLLTLDAISAAVTGLSVA